LSWCLDSLERKTNLGVDGNEKGCKIAVSVERNVHRRGTGRFCTATRSLTVCAGDLCGRLGVDVSPSIHKASESKHANAS
jgi:hypothetical protein